MAATILVNRDRSALSREQIARHIPAAMAEAPHDSRSSRYLYVPTIDMIDTLAREGFEPVYAVQSRARDASRRDYTKHMIRFAHQGSAPLTRVGETRAEVVLTNSHDGTSSVQLSAGVFRLACTNGLMVGTASEAYRLQHSRKWADEIIEGTYRVIEELSGPVAEQVETMQARDLSHSERLLLAETATAVRWGEGGAPLPSERMLSTRRSADRERPDAWTTLNILQENAIRGGLPYSDERRRMRHTRAVTGIDDVSRINRGLWDAVATLTTGSRVDLASEMFGRLTPEERAQLAARLAA